MKPQALLRVQSEELRKLIELCIAHDANERPEARQLLKHPFFEAMRSTGGGWKVCVRGAGGGGGRGQGLGLG